jgi:tellurite methyltransferase
MDKRYWNEFYEQNGQSSELVKNSSFADFCLENYFSRENINIIELGCGNGRDALFFAKNQISTIAIDQSIAGINATKDKMPSEISDFIQAEAADFINVDYNQYGTVEAFYSRFTIHSITQNDEDILLSKVFNKLNSKGLLCIEVRTTKDPLFGIGEQCDENTFITDHKRRFICTKVFLDKVLKMGFNLRFFDEANNLSIHKNDNPVLMRIILEKP